jgi:hypothetical protein
MGITTFGDCSKQVRHFLEENPRFQNGPFRQAMTGRLTANEFEKRMEGEFEKNVNALTNLFYNSPLFLIQWLGTLFNNRQYTESNISDYKTLLTFVAKSDERVLSLLLILRNDSMGVFGRPLDDILKCCLFKKTFQMLSEADQTTLKKLMTQEELMVLNIPIDMEWNKEGFIIPTKIWADLTTEEKSILKPEWQLGLAVGKGFPLDRGQELIEIAHKVENGHLLLGSRFVSEYAIESDESIRKEALQQIYFNKLKATLNEKQAAELVQFKEFVEKSDYITNNYFMPQLTVRAFLER